MPEHRDSSHATVASHEPATHENSSRHLGVGPLSIDVVRHTAQLSGTSLHLTPSEFALVEALVERPGFVCTRAQLRRRMPGGGDALVDRTVDVYLRNIRRKLEGDGLVLSYVETVFGAGYRLTHQTPGRRAAP
jgi:DNA-binding response OmpR family regulator